MIRDKKHSILNGRSIIYLGKENNITKFLNLANIYNKNVLTYTKIEYPHTMYSSTTINILLNVLTSVSLHVFKFVNLCIVR